jgi:hypothetical protein
MSDEIYIFKIGTVINNSDTYGGGRIQIRISDDDILKNDELPWAFPLMPKHFYIIPKIGEACLVFSPTSGQSKKMIKRFYIGPIISQLDRLDKEQTMTARAFFDNALVDPSLNPQWDQNSIGIYPENGEDAREIGENIGMLGRQNNDILLKDNELWIRVGKYKTANNKKVWSEHPGYIKMKNYKDFSQVYNRVNESGETDFSSSYKTTTAIVSDEIVLISSSPDVKGVDKYTHHGGQYPVNDPKEMIDDETMLKIIQSAHRLPYGDVLVDFLDKMRSSFLHHTHNSALVEPVRDKEIEDIASYDLEQMLTNNIKIN